MKLLLAQLNPIVGDISGNTDKVLAAIKQGKEQGADLILFPELVLCGYPAEDFLLLPDFEKQVSRHLERVVEASEGIVAIVGVPRCNPHPEEKPLCNSAAIIADGQLLGFQDKSLLPTYDVFDERRYFEPAREIGVWELCGQRVGITICEDIWQHSEAIKFTSYHHDPVDDLKKYAPEIILNLSASPYRQGRFQERIEVCAKAARTLQCPIALCNQVGGNDSLIFDGYSFVVGGDGELMTYAKGFAEDAVLVDLAEEHPKVTFSADKIGELFHALVLGVRDYFHKSGFSKACLGISGGIDSAVVTAIAVEALGKENVLGVALPSRYSSEASFVDAKQLVENLRIELKEISIEGPFQAYLDLLEPHFEGLAADATEENIQARIRGMITMALSNKFGYIVLATGNKSELAMGYATLYGDMCGGLGVISDVTKRQVYAIANWLNREQEVIPQNIIEKAPSAELRPNQKDSDTLPDYEIIDNVVEAYVAGHMPPKQIAEHFGYSLELVEELVQKIHRNEYKRRQSAPGLRISEKAFSVGRRFPIVQRWTGG